ncbi:MAG: glycoside hydrolase family 15 protein [Thermoplasmatota archaeon]
MADLADTAARRWTERDSGIWEMRGEPLHHLSSKVMCWAALDRAIDLAPRLGEFANVEVWTAEREKIREAIMTPNAVIATEVSSSIAKSSSISTGSYGTCTRPASARIIAP